MNKVIKKATYSAPHYGALIPPGHSSEHGLVSKPFILYLAILVVVAVAVTMWFTREPAQNQARNCTQNHAMEKHLPLSPNTESDPPLGKVQCRPRVDTDRFQNQRAEDIREPLQETTNIDEAQLAENMERKERVLARTNYGRVNELLRELKNQGLEGDALYAAAADQLVEAYGPDILKLLDGYRSLEQELAENDLTAMSPAERFDYLHKARLHAFGRDMADSLFFETEAYTRNNLEEEAILDDTSLTREEQQGKIANLRNTLQSELASRGTQVSFADERRQELDNKLRDRYGSGLDAMSPEERKAAMWEMYREEMPPAIVEQAERVVAAQERRRAAFEAFEQEREAILNDPGLNYEQRQELLLDLSDRFNNPGS